MNCGFGKKKENKEILFMLRKSTLGNMIGMGCQVGTEPGIQILEILIT